MIITNHVPSVSTALVKRILALLARYPARSIKQITLCLEGIGDGVVLKKRHQVGEIQGTFIVSRRFEHSIITFKAFEPSREELLAALYVATVEGKRDLRARARLLRLATEHY